ncbi:TrmB family transcriptional regulator [Haloarcula onubensis]|uniref:TrmB family transcriptional regulator n=1 Tax=Haloarcula onubensis TaxID=2950539 RepID=A0ABU2FPN8_9EURY|nr:TrmB family transcriptional regulator [Halomicroarcula sp. S3CR25-11]MDS0282717.1 TrmB family transcriptional regulator [Halomicroarcula sp. S3CR25-11]
MDRDTLKQALENADLTAYEAEAYLTLVDYGRLPAVDVAKKSGVPTSQVYDTLRSLESKGFVDTIDQDRLHAEPADPVDILTHLRERGELFTEAAEELEDRWEQPDLKDHRVGVVKHADTVLEHVRNRVRETDVAVEVALTADQFESLRTALYSAAKRGVIVHVAIYYESDLTERSEAWDLSRTNLEVRVVKIPGPFIAVLDRSRTYFAPNSRAAENYGILINDNILSFINHWYYQTCLWYPWPPLVGDQDRPKPYISLKEFIRDISALHHDGGNVAVTVSGIDVAADEFRTVTGTVTDIYYPDAVTDDSPSLEQLSTYAVVTLDTGDEQLTVGGWGAVFEDIEAQKITLEAISFDGVGQS